MTLLLQRSPPNSVVTSSDHLWTLTWAKIRKQQCQQILNWNRTSRRCSRWSQFVVLDLVSQQVQPGETLHSKTFNGDELLVRQAVKGHLATCLQQSFQLLSVSIATSRTWFAAFRVNWPVTFKRTEDRRRQSEAWKHCKVTKWQATYRPLTTCCSPWMKLTSLLSQTPYATLSNSCLAKSCALAADGRSRRCAWSLERPRNEDEKKLQSCSTSSSASDGARGAIFHGATCESANRTSKTLRHCGHPCSVEFCFSCGKSTWACVWTCLVWPALLRS